MTPLKQYKGKYLLSFSANMYEHICRQCHVKVVAPSILKLIQCFKTLSLLITSAMADIKFGAV